MPTTHRAHVEALLTQAADEHAALLERLPPDLKASVPLDAQGLTRAIDHLAAAARFSEDDRRELIRAHGVNPAVMHARVFGGAPLTRDTVLASFVDGARVRADALATLADAIGGEELGSQIRNLLLAHPPPADPSEPDALSALRRTYDAHERAAVLIAEALDR